MVETCGDQYEVTSTAGSQSSRCHTLTRERGYDDTLSTISSLQYISNVNI